MIYDYYFKDYLTSRWRIDAENAHAFPRVSTQRSAIHHEK